MPGPAISIPLDLSSLTNAKEKTKALRKELKDANKDIDKAKKAGTEITQAQKQRFQQAQRNLNQYTAQVSSANDRVQASVKSSAITQRQSNFLDTALTIKSKIIAAKGVAIQAIDTATNFFGDRITNENLGKTSYGEDVNYRYTPSSAYRAAELGSKAGDAMLQSKNPVLMAAGAAISLTSAAVKFGEDYQQGQIVKNKLSQLGARDVSLSMEKHIREKYLQENPLSRFDYTAAQFKAARAFEDAKISAIASLKGQRNAAIDLGDFRKARAIMDQAKDIVPGQNPIWKDPALEYTQREGVREAAKAWARNNMQKAGVRTGD